MNLFKEEMLSRDHHCWIAMCSTIVPQVQHNSTPELQGEGTGALRSITSFAVARRVSAKEASPPFFLPFYFSTNQFLLTLFYFNSSNSFIITAVIYLLMHIFIIISHLYLYFICVLCNTKWAKHKWWVYEIAVIAVRGGWGVTAIGGCTRCARKKTRKKGNVFKRGRGTCGSQKGCRYF